jgi:hypothetical protein
VTRVVVPVVVDGVKKRVACDLGRAARGVVDVVVLEGDKLYEDISNRIKEKKLKSRALTSLDPVK